MDGVWGIATWHNTIKWICIWCDQLKHWALLEHTSNKSAGLLFVSWRDGDRYQTPQHCLVFLQPWWWTLTWLFHWSWQWTWVAVGLLLPYPAQPASEEIREAVYITWYEISFPIEWTLISVQRIILTINKAVDYCTRRISLLTTPYSILHCKYSPTDEGDHY